MAFVVIQHLDPTKRGMVPELLQRATKLTVLEVTDGMPVEAGRVYVIPPNRDLSILAGRLQLLEPAATRGVRLPIDSFLRSLAADRGERAVGVILSGMGSDGTLGLRAIKEKAGLALVQDPADALFSAMPRSAIDAGLADIVAPARELSEKIRAYLRHAPVLGSPKAILGSRSQSSLEKILLLLRETVGHDFTPYKKSTLYRRIERRMGIHQIDRIAAYVRRLQEDPAEIRLLFQELLIGVTSFFRDPDAWEELKADVLRPLVASRSAGNVLRAWVPGCSTGEEAYSLAMAFKEVTDELGTRPRPTLQVFATDIDAEAVERARHGRYPPNIRADVSPERLQRFFVEEEPGYQIAKEIRELVVFAVQNLIMDPPFTKLDILSCRNLLIYLEGDCQKKLMPLFQYTLNRGGVLFLGSAETVGGFTSLFEPIGKKARLFRRTDSTVQRVDVTFPIAPGQGAPALRAPSVEHPPELRTASLEALFDHLITRRYAPAAVLLDGEGNLLYVSGNTGKYLQPAAGKASLNVFAMAREGLGYELAAAFHKARREKEAVTLAARVSTNSHWQAVNVTLQPVTDPEPLAGTMLMVFEDVSEAPKKRRRKDPAGGGEAVDARFAELERALEEAKSRMEATQEEAQSTEEELKSANEELQSANEELQSTNEELTTSKEEMQSMNEELQTLNAELVSKVEELSRANNDMKNLLNSTDVATLFLDSELRVRRFTTPAAELIRLIPSDVGRPITDITSSLDYPDLTEDVREVLRTLSAREKVVPGGERRWFAARILPYRTADNRIDGVVMTFWDVTSAKKLEEELGRARRENEELRRQAPAAPPPPHDPPTTRTRRQLKPRRARDDAAGKGGRTARPSPGAPRGARLASRRAAGGPPAARLRARGA